MFECKQLCTGINIFDLTSTCININKLRVVSKQPNLTMGQCQTRLDRQKNFISRRYFLTKSFKINSNVVANLMGLGNLWDFSFDLFTVSM